MSGAFHVAVEVKPKNCFVFVIAQVTTLAAEFFYSAPLCRQALSWSFGQEEIGIPQSCSKHCGIDMKWESYEYRVDTV